MGLPVNTVATGGLPIVESTSGLGTPVSEAAPGRGVAVTKVISPQPGLPVIFETIGIAPNTGALSGSDKVNVTLSNGGLTATATAQGGARTATGFNSGKYYWEQQGVVWVNNSTAQGIAQAAANLANVSTTAIGVAVTYRDGSIYINGASQGAGVVLGTRVNGDIIGIAADISAKLIWFRVCPSGNWNNSAANNPATGVGGLSIASIATGVPLYPVSVFNIASDKTTCNFGASAFSGAVPSGFTSGWPA